MLLLVTLAHAEDPSFAGTDKPGQAFEKPEALLSAELGGVLTSGNTQTWALNGTLNGSYKWARNKLGLVAGVNVGQSVVDANADGHLDPAERTVGFVETARRYYADGRYDRYFGERNSLYLLVGTLADPFAGYDNRSHGQLGYSRVLVDSERVGLVAELGADAAREDFVAGVVPESQMIYAAREMVAFRWNISETAAFTEQVEAYENVLDFADLRVLNSAALTASLTGRLSLKLSHQLAFDNVPVEGFEKLDQTTMATLVVSIL